MTFETSWREINESYSNVERARKKIPPPVRNEKGWRIKKVQGYFKKKENLSNTNQQFADRLNKLADRYNIKDVGLENIIERLHRVGDPEKKVSKLLSKWADR